MAQDLHDALAVARHSNPETLASVVAWTYGFAIQYGVLRADDTAVCARRGGGADRRWIQQRCRTELAEYTLSVALLSREAAADRHRGLELMMQVRDIWLRERAIFLVPVADLFAARERARRGGRDAAIPVMRQAVNELQQAGRPFYGVWGTGVLVETLLECCAEGDLAEARETIDRLVNVRGDQGSAILEITLVRLRALLAGRAVTMLPTGTWWDNIARWRNRLASTGTSSGPRR